MEYTITWFIENYSYCYHKKGEVLISPQFFANGLENTAWYLRLYPRGNEIETKGSISLFLVRSHYDDGPDTISLKYELSFLGSDGLPLKSEERQCTFQKNSVDGYPEFLKREEVLVRRKADFLPQDTLSVRCKIRMIKGAILKVEQSSARTRIGIEKISFIHALDFSSLEPNACNNRYSAEEDFVTSSVHLADSSCCDGEIILEIIPARKQILLKCNLFLLGISGIATKCVEEDNRFDETRKDISKLHLSVAKKDILIRKSEYLPDDTLSLLCECIFSSGMEYEKIETILREIPSSVLNYISNDDLSHCKHSCEEKLSVCSSLSDDLKDLYNAQLLSDVELKTETKSYPAHKNLLCARSPVFKAMLTNDMKEKNTNCIKVDDLENDTVERLLNFLYSDNIGQLQWDTAIKLYYASDKYSIQKLKLMCSSVLLDSINTSNATELLLLADTHNDSDLKRSVEHFILKHEEQVFSSDEWVKLVKINPVLVSKTMLLKYVRCNKTP